MSDQSVKMAALTGGRKGSALVTVMLTRETLEKLMTKSGNALTLAPSGLNIPLYVDIVFAEDGKELEEIAEIMIADQKVIRSEVD